MSLNGSREQARFGAVDSRCSNDMKERLKGDPNDIVRARKSNLDAKAAFHRIAASPITIFVFIVVFGFVHHEVCFATNDNSLLHMILGCDLVGSLSLHGR
jgi:hypothetical protein